MPDRVSVLDDGRAAKPVAEVALCSACLAGVASACGFGAYVAREGARG